jgi:hypothetical protein
MKLPVNLEQAAHFDARVDLCRADGGVAEDFLNDAKVRSPGKHVGREAVA